MKRGDILINRWAGHIDCRYFIYLGTQGDWIVGLEFIEGRPSVYAKLKMIQIIIEN